MNNKRSIARRLAGKSRAAGDDARNFTRQAAASGNSETPQINCGMK
ncbi:MAG: hypothetical protein VZR11_05190 [Succinimonas sp.]|nr:hypothetical protein [Succinimonas sp.]